MPFTPINVVNGSTPANATWGNLVQTQYTESTLSFNPDMFTAFVVSGYTAAKDGSINNQLDVAAGTAYLLQSDGTTRQRKLGSSTQTTSTPSTTYHLYLQPDGTFYWNTANSPATNSLAICNVTTDGSGNISTVTDARVTGASLLSAMTGFLTVPMIAFNEPLSAGNKLIDLQQGFSIFSDNTASVFAGATSRLWFSSSNATGTQEVHIGPRASNMALAGFRVLANNVIVDANGSGGAGAFSVQGGVTTSLDAGKLTTDGTGLLTFARTNGSANQLANLMNNFGLFSDNVGAFFSGGTTRLWLSAAGSTGTQEMHLGPRTGGQVLAGLHVKATAVLMDGNGSAGAVAGAFAVAGGMKTSLDAGNLTTDGTNGTITKLGGQATAGSFGVAGIVAQAIDVAVTVTTMQTILSYTPTVTGYYRVSAYLAVKGSGVPNVLLEVFYTDPLLGAGQNLYLIGTANAAPGVAALTGVNTNDANQAVAPVLVKCASGNAIQIKYQNFTATPNDLVTVFIERMS